MSDARDIWSLAETGEGMVDGKGLNPMEVEDASTILVVGDAQCGKSTLIQSFLKPNSSKTPKPTFALEYNFARRKNAGDKGGKTLSNIWELGGDIYEPKLLEIALTTENLLSSSVIIVLDLSKPQDCFESVKSWISCIRGHITSKINLLKNGNNNQQNDVKKLRENAIKQYTTTMKISAAATSSSSEGNKNEALEKEKEKEEIIAHPDQKLVKATEIPICIMATKYDLFRNKFNSSDRRTLMQILRFAAHYHGASFLVTSCVDSR
jgi:dynein light intermediate chain 2, cytosolic